MKRHRTQKGHSLLELAVAMSVMTAVLMGTVQFGYAFYVYNQLVTAVGEGARYAAQRTYRAASSDDVSRGADAVRNMVIYGDPRPTTDAQPLIPGLRAENVEVKWQQRSDGTPEFVSVSVHNFAMDAVFRSFTFDQKPSVAYPYVGRFAPGEREP